MRVLPVTIAALLALAAPASAGVLDEPIAHETRAFLADAHRGTIVWSGFDPGQNAFVLKTFDAEGQPRALPAGPSPEPFDLDVGPNADGRAAVVYSRCAPGCDIFRADLETGHEELLPGSTPESDEREPVLARNRIAFARGTSVVVRNLLSGAEKHMPRPARDSIETITGIAFDGRDVAYTATLRGAAFREERLYAVRGRRAVQIDYATSGGANTARLLTPGISNGRVYYARTNWGDPTGNRFKRAVLRTGALEESTGTSRACSVAWSGSRLLVATGEGDCASGIDTDAQLAYSAKPRWKRARKRGAR